MGAHVAIDPRETNAFGPRPETGNRPANLIYENVGRPGMLAQIIAGSPFDGRIVMGGYCMEEEAMFVFAAQNKRLNIQFAGGEEPQDMALALRLIDEGTIDVTPWLGETVAPAGLAEAIRTMSDPGAPVRTVVDPRFALTFVDGSSTGIQRSVRTGTKSALATDNFSGIARTD